MSFSHQGYQALTTAIQKKGFASTFSITKSKNIGHLTKRFFVILPNNLGEISGALCWKPLNMDPLSVTFEATASAGVQNIIITSKSNKLNILDDEKIGFEIRDLLQYAELLSATPPSRFRSYKFPKINCFENNKKKPNLKTVENSLDHHKDLITDHFKRFVIDNYDNGVVFKKMNGKSKKKTA